jgi:hypothetical protein
MTKQARTILDVAAEIQKNVLHYSKMTKFHHYGTETVYSSVRLNCFFIQSILIPHKQSNNNESIVIVN